MIKLEEYIMRVLVAIQGASTGSVELDLGIVPEHGTVYVDDNSTNRIRFTVDLVSTQAKKKK